MPEGLSPTEVGKEIAEHRAHAEEHAHETHDGAEGGEATGSAPAHAEHERRDRLITIIEAVILAVVAVLAAWSGFAAAKWSTESSLKLAKASTARNLASRAQLAGLSTKNFDSLTFDAWFTAYAVGNKRAMEVAERRFRPGFRVAFNAWLATHPFTNEHAPPGPTYMPQYVPPGSALTAHYDALADHYYRVGESDGNNSDGYVRTTVLLATVLFLVGIAGHFRERSARLVLVVMGVLILSFAVVLLAAAPKPML
jgi:hypothetical protein